MTNNSENINNNEFSIFSPENIEINYKESKYCLLNKKRLSIRPSEDKPRDIITPGNPDEKDKKLDKKRKSGQITDLKHLINELANSPYSKISEIFLNSFNQKELQIFSENLFPLKMFLKIYPISHLLFLTEFLFDIDNYFSDNSNDDKNNKNNTLKTIIPNSVQTNEINKVLENKFLITIDMLNSFLILKLKKFYVPRIDEPKRLNIIFNMDNVCIFSAINDAEIATLNKFKNTFKNENNFKTFLISNNEIQDQIIFTVIIRGQLKEFVKNNKEYDYSNFHL